MVPVEAMYNAFSQSIGREGAEKVVQEGIVGAGLVLKNEYEKDDAIRICDFLKGKPGLIKTIASLFISQILVGKM